MKKLISYFIVIVVLHSCGGLSDAERVLRNEKKSNTDEFLVKKSQPLTLPPGDDALPEPRMPESHVGGQCRMKGYTRTTKLVVCTSSYAIFRNEDI